MDDMRHSGEMQRFIDEDIFARHVGLNVVDHGPGYTKVTLTIASQHLNSAGILHGGAIFSLADFAFAIAANSRGRLALAINASVSFCKAVSEGTLVAEAREVALSAKLGTYLIDVRDQDGALIAQMQGTVYRKGSGERPEARGGQPEERD